jgi:WD40 repeat protein
VLPNGKIVIAGGAGTVEVYDPATGKFTTARGDMGTTRWYQTATLLPNGKVLIAGGYDDNGQGATQTWLWEP